MTDVEFANCNLDQLIALKNNKGKKFYQLQPGDKVYCIQVIKYHGTPFYPPRAKYYKYEFTLDRMEKPYMADPYNNKIRKYNFYFQTNIPRYPERPINGLVAGIQADKNVSSFINYKKIYKDDVYVQIYATSLEEAILKTEMTIHETNIENKLEWVKPNHI